MKELIIGFLLFSAIIIIVVLFKGDIQPDTRVNDEGQQCQDFGEGKGCW